MAKTISTDVEMFRRAVAFEAIELGRPAFLPFTPDEARQLVDGDPETRGKLAQKLIERELWEQDAPSDFLSKNSYGFAIQHKARERLYKLAALDGLGESVGAGIRASSDAELLERVRFLGLADAPTTPTRGAMTAQADDSGV